MTQATDYSIANQSGANFRSELNTILAAVVSQNSGSTAPATTYAYQWWIDTGVTPALLKIRNAANSGWITIGDVTTAGLGLLSAATAATTYAPIASPTFTGTVTIPSGASISGYVTSTAAASTYAPLASPTFTGTVTIPSGASISGYLTTASAASTYAPLASPTFTGTVTIPSGASISGYLTTASAASTYLALAGGTLSGSVTFASGQAYPQIPANSKTSAYTLVAGDAGKHINITTGGVTVPSGVFSVGDTISIYNNSASDQTITQGTSVTLRQAGTATTGNRTLAQYGVATVLCVASNTFVITGTGLT